MSIFREYKDFKNSKGMYDSLSFKDYRTKLKDRTKKEEQEKEIYQLINVLLKDIAILNPDVDTKFIQDYIFSNAYKSGSSVEVKNNNKNYIFTGKLGSQDVFKLDLSLSENEEKKLNFSYYQTPDIVLIRNKNPNIEMEEISYKLQENKQKSL